MPGCFIEDTLALTGEGGVGMLVRVLPNVEGVFRRSSPSVMYVLVCVLLLKVTPGVDSVVLLGSSWSIWCVSLLNVLFVSVANCIGTSGGVSAMVVSFRDTRLFRTGSYYGFLTSA